MMTQARILPLRREAQPDAELVAAARGGDAWAMNALFARHAKMVNNLVYRLLGRDSDIDDVVQESFVQAIKSLAKLQDPRMFVGWLSAVVIRTTHKFLRRRRLMVRLGLRHSDPVELEGLLAVSAPPDVVAELKRLYITLNTFPADLRITLLLRRVEGMTLEQISASTGASLSTTKRRLSRAEDLLAQSHEAPT